MLTGKVAIVTGATSGIGRATASLFASNGAKVSAVGRNETELGRLAHDERSGEGMIRPHLADVTEISHVDRVVSDTVDQKVCGRGEKIGASCRRPKSTCKA